MSKWYSFKELKQARTPMLLDSVTGLPDNHVITVVERVISVDDPELIQNNVRTDTFTLNLDAEYDDLNVVVIFTKPNNINVKVAYNGTPTHIPGSAMELVGSLACSVVGIDADGEVRAVTKAAPDTFQVVKSGAYDGSVTSDDAELLGQILQAVSDAEAAITEAETATTAATNATSQATSAATSANKAASSANSAASSANSAASSANSAAVDAQNAYDTLQPYMATIDSCANILHREVGPDTVVTADDSFPCKPVEMVVYGNTVQNLWVNPSGTKNGVTVTANANGSMTLSGTPNVAGSSPTISSGIIYTLRPNTTYIAFSDKAVADEYTPNHGACLYVSLCQADGTYIADKIFAITGNLSVVFTTDSSLDYAICRITVRPNTTVSGTYRVMLREATPEEIAKAASTPQTLPVYPDGSGPDASDEELGISPLSDGVSLLADSDFDWCPPGLSSIDNVEVVTAGKNLLRLLDDLTVETVGGVTFTPQPDGGILVNGTNSSGSSVFYNLDFIRFMADAINDCSALTGEVVTKSGNTSKVEFVVGAYFADGTYRSFLNQGAQTALIPSGAKRLRSYLFVANGITVNNEVVYPQLELGFTATDYESPNITTTPIDLQGHTLNSLPDGTRDELHIDGGGNVVLEKRTSVRIADTAGVESSIAWRTNYTCTNEGASLAGVADDEESYLCDKFTQSGGYPYVSVSATSGLVSLWNRTGSTSPKSIGDSQLPFKTIYKLAEPQTIDLGTITPPTMAAPNVTAYVADDTPAEMELDYVRDINIVVDRLEKKVADLVVTEATIV